MQMNVESRPTIRLEEGESLLILDYCNHPSFEVSNIKGYYEIVLFPDSRIDVVRENESTQNLRVFPTMVDKIGTATVECKLNEEAEKERIQRAVDWVEGLSKGTD